MANEIRHTITVSCTNGNYGDSYTDTVQINQAVPYGARIPFIASTSDTALTITGFTQPGLVTLQNLDGTNYCDWGADHSGAIVPCGRLMPGEQATFRMYPTATLRFQAHTASCRLTIFVLEN